MSDTVVLAIGGNALAPAGLGDFAGQEERARGVADDGGRAARLGAPPADGPRQRPPGRRARDGPGGGRARDPHAAPLRARGDDPGPARLPALAGDRRRARVERPPARGRGGDDPGGRAPGRPGLRPAHQADRPLLLGGPRAPAGRGARGWDVAEDAGRGWRRVVASPEPVEVVECLGDPAPARRGRGRGRLRRRRRARRARGRRAGRGGRGHRQGLRGGADRRPGGRDLAAAADRRGPGRPRLRHAGGAAASTG